MTSGTNRRGTGCLTIFALPFCGVGLWAAYQVMSQFAGGVEDWEQTGLMLVFALVFGGSGFGFVFWARHTARKQAEEARLKQAHPDQPWMWQPDWAHGRIEGSSHTTMIFAWVFALFWNLISLPLLFQLPEEVIDKQNYPALVGLLFPVAGVGFLIWAIRATLRWKKFGLSLLEMATVPGVVDGRLRGTVQTRLQAAPEEGIELTLTCVHRRESEGRNDSSRERILWQEGHTVGREHLYPSYQGLSYPVDFHIPYECRETDKSDDRNKILWRLEATAKAAGVDYQTRFEVPVFKTEKSSAEPAEERAFTFRSERQQEFDPRTATITVRPSAGGGTEYYFPAARNIGAAVSATIFLLIFAGAIWLQLHLDIFLIFPILTGVFALLLLFFVVSLWCTSSRVVIESGGVRIHRSTLGFRTTTVIPCEEVSDVNLHVGMQQNQTVTQSGQAYYDIEFHRQPGRKVTAGRGVRNKREAEWLAEQMLLQIAKLRS